MSNWLNKIKIGDIVSKIQDDEIDVSAGGKLVAKRIKVVRENFKLGKRIDPEELRTYQEELWEIEEAFEEVEETEEFDDALAELYDFGDVSPGGFDRMLWVDFYEAPVT